MTEREGKILSLYRSGMLIKHIASEVGMAPNSVGVVLKRLGVERPAKPQKQKTHLDEAAIVKAWDDGLATSAIIERFQVPKHLVIKTLKAAGRDVSIRRLRYDGRAGTARRSGNAFARIASRT